MRACHVPSADRFLHGMGCKRPRARCSIATVPRRAVRIPPRGQRWPCRLNAGRRGGPPPTPFVSCQTGQPGGDHRGELERRRRRSRAPAPQQRRAEAHALRLARDRDRLAGQQRREQAGEQAVVGKVPSTITRPRERRRSRHTLVMRARYRLASAARARGSGATPTILPLPPVPGNRPPLGVNDGKAMVPAAISASTAAIPAPAARHRRRRSRRIPDRP